MRAICLGTTQMQQQQQTGSFSCTPALGIRRPQRCLVMRHSVLRRSTLTKALPKIKVIGVGGAACKTVQHLWSTGSHNNTLTCILMDTDAQALSDSQVPDSHKVLLGGGHPNFLLGGSWQRALGYAGLGKAALTLQSAEAIGEAVEGADLVVVVAAVGGQTARSAAPVVAEIARGHGAMTVAVAAMPRSLPARQASTQAMHDLQHAADALIVLPTHKLTEGSDLLMTNPEVYGMADRLMAAGIHSIADWVTNNEHWGDVEDLRSNMAGGVTWLGHATAIGPDRAACAATAAIHSPFKVADASRASSVLVLLNAPVDCTWSECQEIYEVLSDSQAPSETGRTSLVCINNPASIGPISVTMFVTVPGLNESSYTQQAGSTARRVMQP